MLANIHEYVNCCHYFYFLLSNVEKILHVAFVLPVSIDLSHIASKPVFSAYFIM